MNPNVIVIGTPRSGTSITASVIQALGWHFAEDANWGGESKALLDMHHRMIDRERQTFDLTRFEEDTARRVLSSLASPWLLKDPTFCYSLPCWLPLLTEACDGQMPVLIWSMRSDDEVEASWRRRTMLPNGGTYITENGEVAGKRSGITFQAYREQAERAFDAWEGVKVRVDLDDLKSAAQLVHTTKTQDRWRRLRTWSGFALARLRKSGS